MNLEQRIQLLEERLAKQSPYRQFEYVEVTFPSTAHQDLVVSHTLTPTTPDHIVYRVERSNLPVRVYHDETPDRKSWGRGFIVLRADQANVKVRLLVAVPEDDRVFKAEPQELPAPASVAWGNVDKAGSSLADLATRNHAQLNGIGADDHHAQQHALGGADHTGTLPWGSVDKTGALPSDVGAAPAQHDHQHALASSVHSDIEVSSPQNGQLLAYDSASGKWKNGAALTLSDVYPVGSVYISVDSTNPATLFGFGTWVAFATGRTLVGIDPAQAEFDAVEETGGEKAHTLTVNEMPAHNHAGSTVAVSDKHGHTLKVPVEGLSGVSILEPGDTGTGPDVPAWTSAHDNGTTNGTTGSITATPTIASQGGGAAHNNLQPYVVVFIWKRTA